MSCTVYEMAVGALLHDIGKVLQRAFGSIEDLDCLNEVTPSEFCSEDADNIHSHLHAMFTRCFFDLMKKQGLSFPGSMDLEKIASIASYHHRPDGAPHPELAWICAMADRYSAGVERKCEDPSGPAQAKDAEFRFLPLKCLFDEIMLDPKRPFPSTHSYRPKAMDPFDSNCLLPIEGAGREENLPEQYRQMWEAFWYDYTRICHLPEFSQGLFEEALAGLLERYMWAVSANAVDMADISLFDHAATTAAIAACLFKYHERERNLDSITSICDDRKTKFRFLSGDLTGIQQTLFTLQKQGVKGANKILRARSFMLSAIAEAAVIQVLQALDLPRSCLIQQAGGRFLILTPLVPEASGEIAALQARFDHWLLDNYTGSLSMQMAFSEPFSGRDFHARRLPWIFDGLAKSIDRAKQQPLANCSQGVLVRQFPYERVCGACGVRPATVEDGGEFRCQTCQREFKLGKNMLKSVRLAWTDRLDTLDRKFDPIPVLDLDLFLLASDELPHAVGALKSLRNLNPGDKDSLWALRLLSHYIPRLMTEAEAFQPRYAPLVEDDFRFRPGVAKTFAHIGADALEPTEDGMELKGRPLLALLKADVDFLGYIFSRGLRLFGPKPDRFSIARVAQLSRMMDLYFSGFLQGVLRREFPDTYTVYAGGDDLLLIGPWRQSLDLALRIRETFSAYTGHNPHITISAGLSLLHPSHPVNRAVEEAERFLDRAKESGRNRICAVIAPAMSWDEYKDRIDDAGWFHSQMNGAGAVNTAFIYRLLAIAEDAEAAANGDVTKVGWRSKLAYHLARNVKGETAAEKMGKRVRWIKRLGADDLFRLGSQISQRRLPFSIAIYRNRN